MSEIRTSPPEFRIVRDVMSLWVPQAIHAAAELGIADLLASGPLRADQIAERLETHPDATRRLLNALSVVELVRHQPSDDTFAVTELGACLRSDAAASRRAWARLMGGSAVWQAWGKLADCVRTGTAAFRLDGCARSETDVFDAMLADSKAAAIFHRAMLDGTSGQGHGIIAAIDFSGVTSVVDVGGGYGALLSAALEANPGLRGYVFDLEHARAGAEALLVERGLAERARFVAGNLFESGPPPADLFLLKSVIHDWSDQRSLAILRKCRDALPDTGRLVVIEPPAPEPGQTPAGAFAWIVAFSDLNMLVNTGGRERTATEYAALLAQAGLRVVSVKTVRSRRAPS